MDGYRASMRRRIPAGLLATTLFLSSCASLSLSPTDEHTGTFRSRALAVTFFGSDYPQSAILLARANASDAALPNLVVSREWIFPYFWKLDFLLDVLSIRFASVSGTYGPAD
jgi:hypothetical protein